MGARGVGRGVKAKAVPIMKAATPLNPQRMGPRIAYNASGNMMVAGRHQNATESDTARF